MDNKIFYAYLNSGNLICAWECSIGRMRTTNEISKNWISVSSFFYYYLLNIYRDLQEGRNDSLKTFIAELEFESIRERFYPRLNSRLDSLFFFDSVETCNQAIDTWHGRRKEEIKESIVQVDFEKLSISNYTRVDSNFWTYYNKFTENKTWNEKESYIKKYWEGSSLFKGQEIYEYLVHGEGVITKEEKIRQECYREIQYLMEPALPILNLGKALFNSNPIKFKDACQIIPFVCLDEFEDCIVLSGKPLMRDQVLKDFGEINKYLQEHGITLEELGLTKIPCAPDFTNIFFCISIQKCFIDPKILRILRKKFKIPFYKKILYKLSYLIKESPIS